MKTLEQHWQGYQTANRLHEISELQRADLRAAFFYGASCVFHKAVTATPETAQAVSTALAEELAREIPLMQTRG